MAKFHEKAVIAYVCKQLAENVSVVQDTPAGTITTIAGNATVTGSGTSFLTVCAPGAYMYSSKDEIIGRIASVESNTSLTLEDVVPASATPYSEGVMAIATAITGATRTITGVMTATEGSTAVTGTNFVTNSITAGDTIYTAGGTYVGVVASVGGETALTLRKAAEASIAGAAYVAKAGAFRMFVGPKNAVAALNLNLETALEKDTYVYSGSELERDEQTVIKDKYFKADFETLLPRLGTIAGADPVASEVPLSDVFEACGFAAVLSTGSAGKVTFTNSLVSNDLVTIVFMLSSGDLVNSQKSHICTNARGLIDLDLQVGTKVKLKFLFQGNYEVVDQRFALVADYGEQKQRIAANVNKAHVTLAELVKYTSGSEPSLTNVSNFDFNKLVAPNVAGWDYQRFLGALSEGWSKGATPSDVTITIAEDSADATYDPYAALELNHRMALKFGSGAGNRVELHCHKLQLGEVSKGSFAAYRGLDLKFRNVGTTDIILS